MAAMDDMAYGPFRWIDRSAAAGSDPIAAYIARRCTRDLCSGRVNGSGETAARRSRLCREIVTQLNQQPDRLARHSSLRAGRAVEAITLLRRGRAFRGNHCSNDAIHDHDEGDSVFGHYKICEELDRAQFALSA